MDVCVFTFYMDLGRCRQDLVGTTCGESVQRMGAPQRQESQETVHLDPPLGGSMNSLLFSSQFELGFLSLVTRDS